MLEEEELLPPDPELPDSKVRPNRGVKSQEDSGDESLSMGRMSLLCVWGNRSLCEGLSSLGDFPCLAQGAFKLQRGGSTK